MSEASPLEIVWTGLALVGLGASIFGFTDAWVDAKRLRPREVSNQARIVARMNLRNEVIRLFVLFAFVVIGLAAMTLPNDPDAFVGARLLVAGGFIVVSVLMVFGTYADRRDRYRLIRE